MTWVAGHKMCVRFTPNGELLILKPIGAVQSSPFGPAQPLPHLFAIKPCFVTFCVLFCFRFSTINPILYNVMSHRYRVAFKETLCGKKKSFYNNGFVREQSSFRETTIHSSYDTVSGLTFFLSSCLSSKFLSLFIVVVVLYKAQVFLDEASLLT